MKSILCSWQYLKMLTQGKKIETEITNHQTIKVHFVTFLYLYCYDVKNDLAYSSLNVLFYNFVSTMSSLCISLFYFYEPSKNIFWIYNRGREVWLVTSQAEINHRYTRERKVKLRWRVVDKSAYCNYLQYISSQTFCKQRVIGCTQREN